jgi:hypothetical protein
MGEIFMAQRLATEYKHIHLELSSKQLQEFMELFKAKNFAAEVRVFDNGDTNLIVYDDGTEIPLAFRNIGHLYHFEGSYTIKNLQLAHTMRRAVREFKGHALVHRLYDKYTMEYQYEYGNVITINEMREGKKTLIYEFNDTIGKLTRLFAKRGAEDQIAWVQLQIDMLLEQRSKWSANVEVTNSVDIQLKKLCDELFILEA